MHLERVRRVIQNVIQATINRIEGEGAQGQSIHPGEVMALALVESADELLKLDGYERKARSRRKKAFRALWQ